MYTKTALLCRLTPPQKKPPPNKKPPPPTKTIIIKKKNNQKTTTTKHNQPKNPKAMNEVVHLPGVISGMLFG